MATTQTIRTLETPSRGGRVIFRRVLPAANAIFIGHVIVRLGSLVLVPMFLRYWSAALYGEYLALFAAVGYLGSLDVGVQWAAVNRLTQTYARNDLAEYRSVQHSTLAFYLVLAFGVTAFAALTVWLLPLKQWLGLQETAASSVAFVVVLLAMFVVWSMPMRLLCATYQTTGDLARSQWTANIQQVLAVLLSGAALVVGGGMRTIALLQVLTVLVIGGYVLLDVHRRLPALFPGIRQARLVVLKQLARPSFLFALLVAGNLIAYQGSVLVVSAALGGLAVAVLSVSKAIIEVVRQCLYSVNLALCPDFARMDALGEYEKLRTVHRIMMAVVAAITLAVVASMWYEGGLIITIWTRGRIAPDPMLLRLFLVLMAFQTPWAASSTVATATNRHQVQAIGYFCAAISGIALVAALVGHLGPWAVPVGLALGEAIGCYHFVIKATCEIIGEHYAAFAFRFWLGFAVVGAAVLATARTVHSVPGPFFVRWIAMGVCTLAVATISAWAVWLRPEDRALLLLNTRDLVAAKT